jgi:predicted extracellular nuclease
MKYKNGQLIEIMWEDFESDVEYVKGHVTIEQAIEAYNEHWGRDSLSDYSMMFYAFDEKTKGSFPVTELQLRKAQEK